MLSRMEASDAAARPDDSQPGPDDSQPEPGDSSATAGGRDQDTDEGDEFIARQVLEKDATFFGG